MCVFNILGMYTIPQAENEVPQPSASVWPGSRPVHLRDFMVRSFLSARCQSEGVEWQGDKYFSCRDNPWVFHPQLYASVCKV